MNDFYALFSMGPIADCCDHAIIGGDPCRADAVLGFSMLDDSEERSDP
jgi:hypothetical protein